MRHICKSCKKEFEKAGNRIYSFCSKRCKGIASRKINKICPVCRKKFGGSKKNRNKYCSQKCMGIARRNGINKNCEWCGNPFYVPQSRREARFCSLKCQINWQGRNKTNHICKICGTLFRWSPSRTKDYNPTYCSIKCRNKDKDWIQRACIQGNLIQQNKKGLNKLELEGRTILKDLNIDFKEQILMFNKFLVDVLIPDSNLIIQWDGEYWHSKPKRKNLDKSQDAYLNKCGYTVLRFLDKEVYKNKECVIENIQRAI